MRLDFNDLSKALTVKSLWDIKVNICDLGFSWAKFTESERGLMPFKKSSQNSVGKDSDVHRESISGFTPGLSGSVGWLPVDDVPGFVGKPGGRPSDGPD